MATPLSNRISIERNTDRRIRVPIYLGLTKRRPTSVVGWTGKLWVKNNPLDPDSAAVLELAGMIEADTTKDFVVDLTHQVMEAFAAGTYRWTVRVVTAEGKEYAIIAGGSEFVVTERGSSVP